MNNQQQKQKIANLYAYAQHIRVPCDLFYYKEVNPRLAKRPLVSNGRLANRGLTSFCLSHITLPGPVRAVQGLFWT